MPSYAPTINSTTSALAGYARKMSQFGRPDVSINLSNHFPGKQYTTHSPINGSVSITSPSESPFDSVQITLEGTIRTFVENLSPHSTKARTTATHNFLRLSMPIAEDEYPIPRIAEKGRRYEFGFNFNVPSQLLPRSCSHHCENTQVHEAHLRLPPSMGGGRELLGPLDDFAPEMGKVTYRVRVQVLRNRERDGEERVLVEGSKKILIIPEVKEERPINVRDVDSEYILETSKILKKGMFSGKLGRITVSSTQPSALVLPPPSTSSDEQEQHPVTTMATLNLRFDPQIPTSQPPRLGGLTTKIKASTYYSARPAVVFPTHLSMLQQFESTRGVYDTFIPLSSRCVEAVVWEKQIASPSYTRRGSDSSTSSESSTESSGSYDHIPGPQAQEGKIFYTSQILVPITLPATKLFLPTFHSCILSRAYTIEHQLSIHTPGTGMPSSSISLKVPVQVAARGLGEERRLSVEEMVEVDEMFRPRVMSIRDEREVREDRERGSARIEMPPSYEDFAGVGGRTVRSRG